VRLTRRQVVAGAAAGALSASGIYALVERFTGAPRRPRPGALPREQHVLEGVRLVVDDGVEVLVPPLHHQVVTAKVRLEPTPAAVRTAQGELEHLLRQLDGEFEPSPAGLGVTVAWGLPYFRRYVADAADAHIPVDRRASEAEAREVRVLVDAIRFPSDPEDTILEDNDVAVLLRSDSLDSIGGGAEALFSGELPFLEPTSIRKGFVGGGFEGGRGLPKRMALAAGVPGAELIPDGAELFLGFTSSQKAGLAPRGVVNFETLGLAELPSDYFRGGTSMHLSHVFEDLEAWYVDFDHAERVGTVFTPRLDVPRDRQTVRQAPQDVSTRDEVTRDFERFHVIGHSAAIQTTSRLPADVRGPDGTLFPKGTAIPDRADFNTLDNPFFWTADPERDQHSPEPAAGIHFLVFNPTSDDFHRNRLAMDGVLPDGTRFPFDPRARGQGFNSVLRTSHRQNFLVPPRRHRSFPLAELL
jgi:hypothetical protein